MYDTTPVEALEFHHGMLVDDARVDRFFQAVIAVIKPGDIVLDLGCGIGVLACFACLAGAAHVYAIERRRVIKVARQIIAANGFADRVTLIKDWSTKVELPQRADVLLTETIGNNGFEEGILRWVVDARHRLLKPGARIVPQRLRMRVAPVEDERDYRYVETWKSTLYTLDFTALHTLAANNLLWSELNPDMLLSKAATLVDVDLRETAETNVRGEATFTILRPGVVHGFGAWFAAELAPDIRLTNAPPAHAPSWSHTFLPLEEALPVKAGEQLHLRLRTRRHAAVWEWQATHYPATAAGEPAHCVVLPKHSTRVGEL